MAHAYGGENSNKFNIGLVIGVPSRGPIHLRWMMHMNRLCPGFLPPGIEWKYGYTIGKAIDVARQEIVEKCLQEKVKYLLFIDDDVFVPLNTIAKLMAADKDVIMGLYWGKAEPCFPVIFEPDSDIGAGPWINYPREQLTRVSGGGLGCCLIKSDIFRKMKTEGTDIFFKIDWLRKKDDGNVSRVAVGEDHYFYDLCKKHGIEVWCDTSIRCDHYDMPNNRFFPTEDIIEKENKMIDQANPAKNLQSKPIESPGKAEVAAESISTQKPVESLPAGILEGIRLNLGCGGNYRAGFVNIDKLQNVKADKYLDLMTEKLPFEDSSVAEILLYDVLEHIQDPFPLMKELWRVCKPGASVDIICPYPWSDYQACDPTHIKAYNEITFSFFSKKAYERDVGSARTQIPIEFDFDIKNILLVPNSEWMDKSELELRAAKKKFLNVVDKIRCLMTAVKN